MVVDRTQEKKLANLFRRMRRWNPIPSAIGLGYRQIPVTTIVEDPVHRDALHSYFIQLVDVHAYFLFQKQHACSYLKKKGGVNYFDRLAPIFFSKASRSDPQGIVRL